MKKYVVALVSYFENEVMQFKIEAESEYEAFKSAMIKFCKTESELILETAWQLDANYPKTIEEIEDQSADWEIGYSITEVSKF